MTDAAIVSAKDVGTPIIGVVYSTDPGIDLTTVTAASLIISGVGTKAATITTSDLGSVTLKWLYDGSLAAGSYPCWWNISFPDGTNRTAPTGTSLSLQVASAS